MHREEGRLASAARARNRRAPRPWAEVPVVAFLVEHPGAGRVLVDTGFHPSIAVTPHEAFGRIAGRVIKDVHDGAGAGRVRPAARARHPARRGGGGGDDPPPLRPRERHRRVPRVDVRRVEPPSGRRPARAGACKGYWGRQFDHAFEWRTVDFESPDADSFATFGRALDLFGDGSVRLVSTPGHTAGHLSVVLRLRDREALLTGDAAYTRRTLEEIARCPTGWRTSTASGARCARSSCTRASSPDALVICGHDFEQWRSCASSTSSVLPSG